MKSQNVEKSKSRNGWREEASIVLVLLFTMNAAIGADSSGTTRPITTAPSARPTTAPSTSTAAATQADGHKHAQPNILVIMTDSQARGFTGFEGNKLAKTPNLDRLAGKSVQFTRCYVSTPQTAPSHASFLTGQYPHVHELTTNGAPISARADTFPMRLKGAGYQCGLVGEWDLTTEDAAHPGFGLTDYVATSDAPHSEKDWLAGNAHINGTSAKIDKYLDDWHGDRAIEAIDKMKDHPFFLWVAFRGPQEPLVYPPGLEKVFPAESMQLPESRTQNQNLWPQKLLRSPAAQRFKQILDRPELKEPFLRESRSKYLAMISRIDENVGRILARLDELKLSGKTVVVFVSAHGRALGEHALFGEGPAFYDELIRVPLLVHRPDVSGGPSQVDRVVSITDLCPTFCEMAGIASPRGIQGASLMGLMRDGARAAWSDEVLLEYYRHPAWVDKPSSGAANPAMAPAVVPGHLTPPPAVVSVPAAGSPAVVSVPPSPSSAPAAIHPGSAVRPPPISGSQPAPAAVATAPAAPAVPVTPPVDVRVRGIVTRQYKFIDYLDDDDLLYDLKRDPGETQNVLSDFHYIQIRKILFERITRWRKQLRDPWLTQ